MHESNFLSAFYFYGCRMEEIDVRVDKAKVERRQRANDDDEFFHKSSFRVFLYHWSSRKVISSRDFLQRFFFFFSFLQTISRDYDYLWQNQTRLFIRYLKKRKRKKEISIWNHYLRGENIGPLWKKCFFRMFPIFPRFLNLTTTVHCFTTREMFEYRSYDDEKRTDIYIYIYIKRIRYTIRIQQRNKPKFLSNFFPPFFISLTGCPAFDATGLFLRRIKDKRNQMQYY